MSAGVQTPQANNTEISSIGASGGGGATQDMTWKYIESEKFKDYLERVKSGRADRKMRSVIEDFNSSPFPRAKEP